MLKTVGNVRVRPVVQCRRAAAVRSFHNLLVARLIYQRPSITAILGAASRILKNTPVPRQTGGGSAAIRTNLCKLKAAFGNEAAFLLREFSKAW